MPCIDATFSRGVLHVHVRSKQGYAIFTNLFTPTVTLQSPTNRAFDMRSSSTCIMISFTDGSFIRERVVYK